MKSLIFYLTVLFCGFLGINQAEAQQSKLFRTYLEEQAGKRDEMAGLLLKGTVEILTDKIREETSQGKYIEIIGRETEADQAIDVLCRLKGKNPVFVGPAGAGKTAVAEKIAVMILRHQYPKTQVFESELNNAEVIRTTPSRINLLAKRPGDAMEAFLEALVAVEKNYLKTQGKAKPLVLYIDELHSLHEDQIEAMKPFLDSVSHGIRLLGSTTSKELKLAFKHNEAMLRRLEPIGVEEMTPEQTLALFEQSWAKIFKTRYNVEFSIDSVKAAIRVSPKLKPDNARPDGPFKVLQDIAISTNRKNNGEASKIQDIDVYQFATKLTGLPSNPFDGKGFSDYFETLEQRLNEEVIDQEKMTHSLVEHFSDLLMSESGRPRVLMMMGPTGVGKTLVGKTFARLAFGSENRFFRIDGTTLARGSESGQVNTVFGANNGIKSADETSGTLMEFLDDPARGKYSGVILIDEAEKMSEDSWRRFMEMFDAGRATGGDGKVRLLSNHIVILTSNRGARLAFPGTVDSWSDGDIKRRIESLSSKDLKDFFLQPVSGDDEFKLPPEILNRVDEFVLAAPVTHSTAVKIGAHIAKEFQKYAKEKFQLKLEIDPKLIEHLALTGFSTVDGARHISRQVQVYLNRALREARSKWNLARNDTLKLEFYQKDQGSHPEIKVISSKNQTFLAEAPKKVFIDPLQDNELVVRLQNLPKVMRSKIIGQESAIKSAVQSITAKMGNPDRQRPLSMFLIGSTGTGKTEFGKAIAEGLFGSKARHAVIPLGGVMSEVDLTEVFGSKPGYVGSLTMRSFEKALTDNPNGGVIILDEISNMGGNNKALKEALFKKFYDILDEGKWTSPATGKTFDLRNYFFLFTGNDGEKLFQGITADDLRIARWREANTRERVRGLLRESGVPEAFLSRPDDIILAKPILTSEAKEITERLLKEQVDAFTAKRPGLKVTWDEHFTEVFSRSFFTQDTGGRSVKTVLENRLGELLVSALLQNGYNPQTLGDVTLQLSINDTVTQKPYILSKAQKQKTKAALKNTDLELENMDGRKVILQVGIYKANKLIKNIHSDLTEFAPVIVLQSIGQAKSTAIHEMGHSIVNDTELTGDRLSYITIRGGAKGDLKYYGYARYEEVADQHRSPTRDSVLAQIARLTGGRAAQVLAGLSPDAGWSNDLEKIQKLGAKYLTHWGMEPTLWGIQFDKDENPVLNEAQKIIFDRELKKLIDQGMELATQVLKARWTLVRAGTAELLKNGMISGERFYELKASFETMEHPPTFEDYMKKQEEREEVRRRMKTNGGSGGSKCTTLLGELLQNMKQQ